MIKSISTERVREYPNGRDGDPFLEVPFSIDKVVKSVKSLTHNNTTVSGWISYSGKKFIGWLWNLNQFNRIN